MTSVMIFASTEVREKKRDCADFLKSRHFRPDQKDSLQYVDPITLKRADYSLFCRNYSSFSKQSQGRTVKNTSTD